MNQEEFIKTIEQFQKLKDARDQLWNRAETLIEKGFEVEAYILILATWNFARFRYFMKSFDVRKFQEVIANANPIFKKLEKEQFENIDFSNTSLIKDIKDVYNRFKQIAEQTGASKLMALKNPRLFIMWDTEIRRIYKINNRGDADDYIQFLKTMREHFKGMVWNNKDQPLAKVIDEYNYVKADEIREKRKTKKILRINENK